MKKISKKTKLILISFCLLVVVAIGVSMAYYTSQDSVRNSFHLQSPGVAVYELFDPSDHWLPEEEKEKDVLLQNTGEMDLLLRFKIDAEWEKDSWERDPDQWAKLKAEYNKDYLKGYEFPDATPFVTYYWNDGNGGKNVNGPAGFTLIDGYYYYNQIFDADENTGTILESVKFSDGLSNDAHGLDFSNREVRVRLYAEVVSAKEESARDKWNLDCTINSDGSVTWPADVLQP